jgi:hypothetical protein
LYSCPATANQQAIENLFLHVLFVHHSSCRSGVVWDIETLPGDADAALHQHCLLRAVNARGETNAICFGLPGVKGLCCHPDTAVEFGVPLSHHQ